MGAYEDKAFRLRVAQERIDEPGGEHLAEVGAELEGVGVDEICLGSPNQDVQIVGIADHDARAMDGLQARVEVAKDPDHLVCVDARPEAAVGVA